MLVFLTGYRGSGKTTVGRSVAKRLGWDFADLDELVTGSAGYSVREIFQREGEVGFRDWESAALRKVVELEQAVIALGGGTLLREDNRGLIPTHRSAVVYLSADPVELHRRIHSDVATASLRPPLTTLGGSLDEIRHVLSTREPVYRQVMTHEIDVTALTPDQVAAHLHLHLTTGNGQRTTD